MSYVYLQQMPTSYWGKKLSEVNCTRHAFFLLHPQNLLSSSFKTNHSKTDSLQLRFVFLKNHGIHLEKKTVFIIRIFGYHMIWKLSYHFTNLQLQRTILLSIVERSPLYEGPVHFEASQPAYRAGAFCRDLTSSPIPIQHLISVHMSRRAGLLGEISLV